MDLLLIHPPVVKAAEPPLGAAVMLHSLRSRGLEVEVLDANLEASLFLLSERQLLAAAGPEAPLPLRRAIRNAPRSLNLLRSSAAQASFPRYSAAVHHLNQALTVYPDKNKGEALTLGDYRHGILSEFAPADLVRIAAGEESTLFARYYQECLIPQIAAGCPRLLALSVNYRHQVMPAFELAGMLRRRFPGVPIIGGGGMFTSWKKALLHLDLRLPAFDRIIFGPGEGPLADLAEGQAGGGYFLESPASLAFTPDFTFARPAAYLSPAPVLPVTASRGCYWRQCLFCPEASAPTHPYSAVAPVPFADLLLELAGRYGVSHFHLTDNALPITTLRVLAERRRDLAALSWHGFVRFERHLMEEGFVEKLAEGGCRLLQLGLESGSQDVLDRLGKGTRLEEIAAILHNLQRAGIATYVYILLGTPGETPQDAEATLAFLEEHAETIGYLNLAVMNLPRDSDILDEPAEFGIGGTGLLNDRSPLGLYRSFQTQAGWDRAAARRFLQQRLLGSTAVRTIVNRTPPLFTSNHAFFFPPW